MKSLSSLSHNNKRDAGFYTISYTAKSSAINHADVPPGNADRQRKQLNRPANKAACRETGIDVT